MFDRTDIRAAVEAGAGVLEPEAAFGEGDAAAAALEQGRVGGDAQVVAGQHHRALHFGVLRGQQGNGQFEPGLDGSCGLGLTQCAGQQRVQRRFLNQHQHLCGGILVVCRDVQHGLVGHVRNVCLSGCQAEPGAGIACACRGIGQFHAQAVKHQLPVQLVQTGPGQAFGRQQGRRQVIQFNIPHASCESEFAFFGVGKRQSGQIPLDLDLYIRIGPFDHGIAHILTHVGRQCDGQVAVCL